MRRIGTIVLTMVLVLSLTACGMKDATELLRNIEKSGETGGERVEAGYESSGGSGSSGLSSLNSTGSDSGSSSDKGGVQIGDREVQLAKIEDYWERMEEERKLDEEENQGYVWTITIDHVSTINTLGIASVDYYLDLSCSHVGPTMFGVYGGELGMSYGADLSGLQAVLGATGGSMSYDVDGWFKNSNFLMRLAEYDKEEEDEFEGMIERLGQDPTLTGDQQQLLEGFMGGLLGNVGTPDQEFEKTGTASGLWQDWDFHMTEGDMSQYASFSGIGSITGVASFGGTVTVNEDFSHTDGDIVGRTIFGSYSERYSDPIENPFPHTIRVYETGDVVFELYGSGGYISVKFFGTLDKVPVGDTKKVE